MILLKFSGFEVCRQWRREGGLAGAGALQENAPPL